MVMNLGDVQSLKTMTLISGGRAHFLAGHLDEARTWLELGLASTGAAYSVWRVSGLGFAGIARSVVRQYRPRRGIWRTKLSRSRDRSGCSRHPSTGDAFLAITLTALEKGEPRRAALSLLRRIAPCRRQSPNAVGLDCPSRTCTAHGPPRASSIRVLALLTSQNRPDGPPPPSSTNASEHSRFDCSVWPADYEEALRISGRPVSGVRDLWLRAGRGSSFDWTIRSRSKTTAIPFAPTPTRVPSCRPENRTRTGVGIERGRFGCRCPPPPPQRVGHRRSPLVGRDRSFRPAPPSSSS